MPESRSSSRRSRTGCDCPCTEVQWRSAESRPGNREPGSTEKGIVNLEKHIENLQKFGVPVVVTLNSFVTDTPAEYAFIKEFCENRGCEFALSEVWAKGGEGGEALAKKVLETLEKKESHYHTLYPDEMSLKDKISVIAKEIYGSRWCYLCAGSGEGPCPD